MRLRTRLTAAFTGVTASVLVASFAIVYELVDRDELREIDHALLLQANQAAATALERSSADPRVRDGTGEIVEPPSLTTRYAATYERDGGVVAVTRSFGEAPALEDAEAPAGTPVDLYHRGVHLRGVLVPLGPQRTLLYAVPRTGVDKDLGFLVRTFAGLFAAATLVTWLVARALARSLVRDVEAIYEVADAVAAGKRGARVGGRAKGSVETRLLAERLDHMIERLEELVASQRVFISSAAHELRSPLTSLRGELELALRRDRTAPEYKETIERALADAVSLVTLADDLLAIARSEGRRVERAREPTRLGDVVDQATRMARGNAEAARVEVVVTGAAKDVAVACAREEVARALRNLLDNAIAHTPSGKVVAVRAELADDRVDIVVEDEGAGVKTEDAPLLFAPFWRGTGERAAAAGAGLGLALAREIARAEGGDVAYDPAHAPGARFVLTLPRA
ncbi:MAG: HAMP domain-containing histidine kinase [Labilithrix sp.]|nr:HAMP domain-containing histidine kinase [Labilithrix sp.]MCW5812850.1 HAMP domain-containing histidine kinase [Labilithrix sp.]